MSGKSKVDQRKKSIILRKVFRLLLLFCSLTVFLSFSALRDACSKEYSSIVDFLCDYAKNLYEKGAVNEAREEFRKVLIIDPDNHTAIKYLKHLGEQIKEPAEPRPVGKLIYEAPAGQSEDNSGEEVSSLRDNNRELQKIIAAKQNEIEGLGRAVAEKEKQIDAIKIKASDDSLARIEGFRQQVEDREVYIRKLELQVKGLEEKISLAKDDAAANIAEAKKLSEQLSRFKSVSSKDVSVYLADIDKLRQDVVARDNEITGLNEELSIIRGSVPEDKIALSGLKQQIESLHKKLALAENDSSKSISEMYKLNKQLSQAREAFSVRETEASGLEKEIANKDKEIESLNKQLGAIQGDSLSSRDSSWESAAQIRRLIRELSQFKKESKSMLQDKEKEISAFKKEVSSCQKQLDEKEKEIKELELRVKG
ncbi:MAG: hypothetical protein KKH80_02160, partial [Candidatus Omnitrophica bacterium]|nr:hypothetical protein [Candidatus Omnitrophota bacterium]